MTSKFDYTCEYCDGFVREKCVEREAFKHKNGFVILENVVVGVCQRCGSRYYSADTLKQVAAVATQPEAADRTDQIPVARAR